MIGWMTPHALGIPQDKFYPAYQGPEISPATDTESAVHQDIDGIPPWADLSKEQKKARLASEEVFDQEAKVICAQCSVRGECLTTGLAEQVVSIRGGVNDRERRGMREKIRKDIRAATVRAEAEQVS